MSETRGGPQVIPDPPGRREGPPAPWLGHEHRLESAGIGDVRRALDANPPATEPPAEGWRHAAVLVPLFEEAGSIRVLLTRRASGMRAHAGEVAFPGGRQDPGESLVDAALREAHEEIGLAPDAVEVIGELDHLATWVTRFAIVPFAGALASRPAVVPNPAEIEHVFDVSLADLVEPGCFHGEIWPSVDRGDHPVHFFELPGETVWGATARILHRLLTLLTVPPG